MQTTEQKVRYHKHKYHTDDEYRRKHIRSNTASQKRRRSVDGGWQLSQLRRIRSRCKERGLPFNITPDDIQIPAVCPALGIPLVLGMTPRVSGSPSIDRVIPALGYVRGNVQIISWRANHLKNNCTDSNELRLIADYMDGHA